MAASYTDLDARLFNHYEQYREPALNHRRFKHAELQPILEYHQALGRLNRKVVGSSYEGRSISLLSVGNGPVKVFLWSQMHGDEPTATMALFDIFRFLESQDDGFDEFRTDLFQNLSLYFLPLLNPDGAENFQRVTAQNIDMNRDALALQTPEARLLRGLIDDLKPDFGFNLHDQNPRYTAGRSPLLATMSFLATAYDYDTSINEVRLRAMQVIGCMNEKLQKFIPGQVGRFSDEHEPRAFGDQIQKSGTSLVLVESGGYKGDIEKQFVRKLNFIALLSALGDISSLTYQSKNQQDYDCIPLNERAAYDLILRHVRITREGKTHWLDIGVDRQELNTVNARSFYYASVIEELGDLSTKYGIDELDASSWNFASGKVFPAQIESSEILQNLDLDAMFQAGYTYFKISDELAQAIEKGELITPVHWLRNTDPLPVDMPSVGEGATFLLMEGERVRYAVVNGFLYGYDTN